MKNRTHRQHKALERHRMRRQAKARAARQARIGVPKTKLKGAFGEFRTHGIDWLSSLARWFGA